MSSERYESRRIHRRAICPYCKAVGFYEGWSDEPEKEVKCAGCGREFAVALGIHSPRPDATSGSEEQEGLKSLSGGFTIEIAAERVKASPEDPLANAVLGQLLYKAGKYEDAIPSLKTSGELFDRMLGGAPQSGKLKAEPGFELGQVMYSERDFRTIVHSTLVMLGDSALRGNDLSEAKKWFRKAVETKDDAPHSWARLAGVLAKSNEFTEAIQACRTALTLDPSERSFWETLHELYLTTGRPETEHIQSVFEGNRSIEQDMFLLADLCISSADYKNALRSLTELLNWHVEYSQAAERLGHLHLLARDYKSAIKVLEPLSKQTTATIDTAQLLARAYLFSGRRKDAEKILALVVNAAFRAAAYEDRGVVLQSQIPGRISPAQYVLRSAEAFHKLVLQIKEHPTQRFSLLTYERGEEAVRTYAAIHDRGSISLTVNAELHGKPPTGVHWYYPDLDVPTGTTLEDLLHWLRTGFEVLFPRDRAVFVVGILDEERGREIVLCNDRTGHLEAAKYEPSALDLFWEHDSRAGLRWDEPILTGDVVFLKLARPNTIDHRAVSSLTEGMRERMLQISAHAVAAEEAEKCKTLREKLLTEQASRKRKGQ